MNSNNNYKYVTFDVEKFPMKISGEMTLKVLEIVSVKYEKNMYVLEYRTRWNDELYELITTSIRFSKLKRTTIALLTEDSSHRISYNTCDLKNSAPLWF